MDIIENYFDYNSKFKIDFSTYVQDYEPRLNLFLNKFVDNSEVLFIDQEIESCEKQINEIKEALLGIEYHSEHRDEYLHFFMNRNVLPFDPDSHQFELSEEGKLMSYAAELASLFKHRIATNYRILEFLKNRIIKNTPEKNKSKPKFEKYYEVGSLFAQGLFIKKGHKYYFKNKSFDSITSLSKYITDDVLKTKSSIKQYINDTLNPRDTPGNKNIYTSHRMKKVIDYCKEKSIKITDEFQSIYTQLENQH